MKYYGRKKPYTVIGISRVKCFRCEKKASQQWQICANKSLFLPICIDCDIKMNELILEFMKFSNRKSMLKRYIKFLGE